MAAPTSDPETRLIDTAIGPVAVAREGDASTPAVICIHGLPGSSRDFRYLGPLLARRLHVLRLDMPGLGRSPVDGIRSIEGWSRVPFAVADALGIERFALLAHSFGGGAALLAAGRQPERIDSLGLMATMGARRHRAFSKTPAQYRRLAVALRFPPTRPLVFSLASRGYTRRGLPLPADWRELEHHLALVGSVSFDELGRAASRYPGPALVFHAPDDPLIEPDIPREIALLLPGARFVLFDGGGHHLQKTRAHEIASAMLELCAAAHVPRYVPAGA